MQGRSVNITGKPRNICTSCLSNRQDLSWETWWVRVLEDTGLAPFVECFSKCLLAGLDHLWTLQLQNQPAAALSQALAAFKRLAQKLLPSGDANLLPFESGGWSCRWSCELKNLLGSESISKPGTQHPSLTTGTELQWQQQLTYGKPERPQAQCLLAELLSG